jgi:hypothetical protein
MRSPTSSSRLPRAVFLEPTSWRIDGGARERGRCGPGGRDRPGTLASRRRRCGASQTRCRSAHPHRPAGAGDRGLPEYREHMAGVLSTLS